MGVPKKLGNEKCPECGEVGRARFVLSRNTKVEFSTENKFGRFIHNDRSIKNCYIGNYDNYFLKQVKDEEHPLKEQIEFYSKAAKDTKYIHYLMGKFAEKYLKSWPLTREEQWKLYVGALYERKIYWGLAELAKLMYEKLLLKMMIYKTAALIPKIAPEEYDKLMPKIKNTIRNLISSDKLLDQSSDQIYRETVGKMDYRPFWPILYHLFAKYELPKREAKAKQLKPKLSEGHFGSEKYPNYDLLTG